MGKAWQDCPQIGRGLEVAPLMEIGILQPRPIGDDATAIEGAAHEQRHGRGAVVRAVIAVDARRAPELGHERNDGFMLEERLDLAAVARAGGMESRPGNAAPQPGGVAQVRAYFAEAAGAAGRFLASADGLRVGALAFDGWDTHVNEGEAEGRDPRFLTIVLRGERARLAVEGQRLLRECVGDIQPLREAIEPGGVGKNAGIGKSFSQLIVPDRFTTFALMIDPCVERDSLVRLQPGSFYRFVREMPQSP
jgi:hypothetical protein